MACAALSSLISSQNLVSAAQPWSAMATAFGRKTCTGRRRYDVVYREAREGLSRLRRRPADCGMPGDGVSFQKNAGYTEIQTPSREGWSKRHRGACVRHGVTDDLFSRQVMRRPVEGRFLGEVNALDSHEHGRSDLRKSRSPTRSVL